MEKIKQNKKYVAVIAVIVILASVLYIPTFATSNNNDPFTALPYSASLNWSDGSGTNSSHADIIRDNGVYLGGSAYYLANVDECYYFYLQSQSNYLYYISNSSATVARWYNTNFNGSNYYVVTETLSYNSTYNCYLHGTNVLGIDNTLVPSYSNVADAIADFNNINPTPSTTPHDISFSLPFGNVAYVDLGDSSSQYGISRHYTGTAYFPELSNLFNNMFGDDYGTWGYASSLPTSSSQLIAPTTKFEFVKTGSTNLLGQSHNGAWSQTSTASSRYLILYNPLNLAGGQGDFVTYNFTIPDAYDVKVFPLNTVFNLSNGISSYQETIGDPITGTIDETTGNIVWTDTNGDTSTGPTIGGQNAINNESTSVVDWLKKIANDIVTFLNRSLESVNVLISGGSAFISKIGALYSWLPGPVYSVIISAITLVFAIGVIKVFL